MSCFLKERGDTEGYIIGFVLHDKYYPRLFSRVQSVTALLSDQIWNCNISCQQTVRQNACNDMLACRFTASCGKFLRCSRGRLEVGTCFRSTFVSRGHFIASGVARNLIWGIPFN